MTRHVAMPARRSAVPGTWVSWCVGCQTPFHDDDRDVAYVAAKGHCAVENRRLDDAAAAVAAAASGGGTPAGRTP